MARKKALNEALIIDAGLQAFNAAGKNPVTLTNIAEKLKVDETDLYPFIQSPSDIYNLITHQTNETLAKTYKADKNDTLKDRVFDIMMERLDLLQPYKTDIARFMEKMPQNPFSALHLFPDINRSITLMLRLSGEKTNDPAKKLAMTWVYLSTIRIWIKDNTVDNAKTMAHLDRCLTRLESWSEKMPFRKKAA